MASHLHHLHGYAAAEHLMRVAAGLPPSHYTGLLNQEQVGNALTLAHRSGTTGSILSQLFRQALQTGHRVRAMTTDSYMSALGCAAMHFLQRHFAGSLDLNVLIVGAGRMAGFAAHVLRRQGVQSIACINRTTAHAETFARQYSGSRFPWYQMRAALAWADLVITATSAQHPIIDAADVAAILSQRQRGPLVLLDIGLPRNVQPSVDTMAGVICYDLDDLRLMLDTIAVDWPQMPEVEQIVQEDTAAFWNWMHARQGLA